MRASQWVRAGLLLVILAFCSYGLYDEWPEIDPWIGQLHVYSIAGSVIAALAGSGCMMLAWRVLLADLGSRLPVLVAARVTFVAQLGKYVPGAVWSFAAHVELGHDYAVPRRRGAASVIVALALAVAVGLLIAACALPLASPAMARRYLFALAVVPVIAVCLVPPILHRILNAALRLIRQEPLEHPLSWRGLAMALGFTALGWVMLGLQAWFLLADVARDGPRSLLLALGAYALACSLALLLVIFPNGIGAREVIMVAALAPVLPRGAALAVAVMARVVTTVSDLTWGGVGLAIARRSRSTGSASRVAGSPVAGRHRKQAGRRAVGLDRQPEQPAAAAQRVPGTAG